MGVLNQAIMMPRDASLSENYKCDRCCFFSQVNKSNTLLAMHFISSNINSGENLLTKNRVHVQIGHCNRSQLAYLRRHFEKETTQAISLSKYTRRNVSIYHNCNVHFYCVVSETKYSSVVPFLEDIKFSQGISGLFIFLHQNVAQTLGWNVGIFLLQFYDSTIISCVNV